MKTFRDRPPIWRRDTNVSFKGREDLPTSLEDAESSACAAQRSATPNLKRKSAGEPLSVGAPPDLKKRSVDPSEALSGLSLFTVDDACMVLILRCGSGRLQKKTEPFCCHAATDRLKVSLGSKF